MVGREHADLWVHAVLDREHDNIAVELLHPLEQRPLVSSLLRCLRDDRGRELEGITNQDASLAIVFEGNER